MEHFASGLFNALSRGAGREASAQEVQQSLVFLKNRGASGRQGPLALSPLAELAHVVLNSNEFVYIN